MAEETFGPYRIVGRLGSGAMGEVSRAVDADHDREIALKRLPPELTADETYRQRFRRESTAVARLRSPHVVPIHRFGEIDGRLYLDMRLVNGVDLAQLLRQAGPLPPARAVAIVEQVASALDAAHSDGLVHRDVKPSNVLIEQVDGGDFAYLADFGIAKSLSATGPALTGTGATIGTLEYMAPERFTAAAIDARSDVYALACVLAECLLGRRPFLANDAASLIHAHLYAPPPVPSAVRRDLPPAFDTVVAHGMAKDPAHRYPTAGLLAADARLALAGGRAPRTFVGPPTGPPSGRPPAPPSPPPARSRRGPLLAVAAVVAVLLLVVAAVLLLRPATPAPVAAPPSPTSTAAPTSTDVPTSTAAPTAPASSLVVRGATVATAGCGSVDGLRSTSATTPARYTITNGSTQTLTVFWVDYTGRLQRWFDLAAGQSVDQETYVSHPWVVDDAQQRCVTAFFAPGKIEIG